MTLQIELDPETEAYVKEEAARRGLDPAQMVMEILRSKAPQQSADSGRLTVEEFHKMLDELRDGLEHLPHIPDSALTREAIYGDHP